MTPQFEMFWEASSLGLGYLILAIVGFLAIFRPDWLEKAPVMPPNTIKVCLIAATIGLPFLAFAVAGLPIRVICGFATIGALFGLVAAPFTSWHFAKKFGKFGFFRVIGIFLLTIASGSWGILALVSLLIAMSSN